MKNIKSGILGKIVSEPKQIGLGFTVKVQWVGVPYDDSLGGYWLDILVSEQVDLQAWQEARLNG
ncbi:hypothetical protein AA637_11750 [Cyanobacterium sp. HL-69]|uniref:hypothetical protein n=1 Tax=Cyanobacterium sp. HL-69 TaxID=2054282 RepID=UPI000CA0F586|nr:hypothetical protein AA637_11750 [Cyanobacterium sp. HL-69]